MYRKDKDRWDEILQKDLGHQRTTVDHQHLSAEMSGSHTQNIMQQLTERKFNFFGHICRLVSNRILTEIALGMIRGPGIIGK